MKVLLISPNGLQELSGGGLYLRSLVQALCAASTVSHVTVVSKGTGNDEVFDAPSNCRTVYLKKNVARDVIGRIGLCPTYLGTYRGLLSRYAQSADVVMFHNSRCGRLMANIRRMAPGKTYAVLSDNVELDLKRQHRDGNMLSRISNAIDTWLIRRAEAPCRTADFMTFITEADRTLFERRYGIPARTAILPISLCQGQSASQRPDLATQAPVVLFTAHFGFGPNQTALQHFAEVANLFREISDTPAEFVVAGAKAAEMAAPYPHLRVVDSPGAAEMAATFASATVYLAPVSWGSGMKTKVAEALSYGVPVICLPNAAVGYETALCDDGYRAAIWVVESVSEMASALHKILRTGNQPSRREAALGAFHALYSHASQTRRLEMLLLTQ